MKLTRIDPVKLRMVIAVAEAGSFAGAAQMLGITQPALSRSVKAMEDALQTRLFERGRAGARPTRHCDLLVSHARTILAEYELAEAELQALKDADDREVAIGASPSLAQSLLPQAIGRFRQRWPRAGISVDIGFSDPLLAGLASGQFDLVISGPETGAELDSRLKRVPLMQERDALVVGVDHPLLAQERIEIGHLLGYPWIIPRHCSRLDHIHAVFSRHHLPPPAQVLRSEAGELARGLLQREPFICLMGEGVLQPDLAAGRIATLPDLGFATSRSAYLFTRRSAHQRSATRNFAAVILEEAKRAKLTYL